MKRFFVKASIGAAGLVALLVPLHGCTDLGESPPSLITPRNFYSSESEAVAALAGIYAQLRSTAPEGTIFDANEISTDEMVVPIHWPPSFQSEPRIGTTISSDQPGHAQLLQRGVEQ